MSLLLFLFWCPGLSWAAGPYFQFKDPATQQEFEFAYQQIAGCAHYNTFPDGSAAFPGLSWATDPDTGLFRPSANTIDLSLGGTGFCRFKTTALIPYQDNAFSFGESGSRWSALWAANGVIQTSSSKLKKNVREIEDGSGQKLKPLTTQDLTVAPFSAIANPEKISVPRGIVFQWKSTSTVTGDVFGFVGDDLPLEAHAIAADGSRDPENFYTSAVVGLLCSSVRKLQAQNLDLLNRVAVLESKVK